MELSVKTKVLSEHPVEPAVRERVLQALADIEREHDVHVVFACESGSRGWGFASPDSDYDVRFVYVHRLPWYMTVEPKRDVIELPISDELDVSGWDLRKALGLLRKSNPTLLEWLDSPLLYKQDDATADRLRALAPAWFSNLRGRYHYLAMARKNFRGYLQGDSVRLKKYLYVLRPLLAVEWVDAGHGRPPMRFAEMAERMITDEALLDEINRLLAIKMRSGEAEYSPRWPLIHAYIEEKLGAEDRCPFYKQTQGDSAELDRFFYESVMAFNNKQ